MNNAVKSAKFICIIAVYGVKVKSVANVLNRRWSSSGTTGVRREAFRERTGTRKALHTTLVTTFGVARNSYYGEIQAEVTLDDLFSPSAP